MQAKKDHHHSDDMTRGSSHFHWGWLCLFVLFLAAEGLLTLFWVKWESRNIVADMKKRAGHVAESLHIPLIQELTGTEADLTSPAYQQLKKQLVSAR